MIKEIITFVDIKIEKRKFHHLKYPININNVDIDKIIILNMDFLVKSVLNTLLFTMMMKKCRHYLCCIRKWMDIQRVLMKL